MRITRLLAAAAALFAAVHLLPAENTRIIRTVNDAWVFTKDGSRSIVNLPHTWNTADAFDDEPGFWRGECSYERTLKLGDEIDGKQVYLRFEGAYQETELSVNGRKVGSHVGGYTAFIFDITDFVHKGDNALLVKVDNKYNPDIPTLTADFTFFGGIYRDVELVLTPKIQIAPDHFASTGVYLSSSDAAVLQAKTYLSNHTDENETLFLEQSLIDPQGKVAASVCTKVKLPSRCDKFPVSQTLKPASVKLWDVEDPQLYRVVTSVFADRKCTSLIDRVSNPFGFRTFRFDPDEGFFLNGRHLKIMGTNRHQDFQGKGNALPDENHVRDVRLLKEMGGNFLRIAHYPQDPVMVQMCDREGIVNSVEIPVVNTVTCNREFADNCIVMAREMVCQGYNNPSTIIWAYMNEVLLRPPFSTKDPVSRHQDYYDFTKQTASRIDAAIRELDPLRPTMIPCNASPRLYKDSGVGEVPDILGWNIYSGWYGGVFADFEKTVESIHRLFPDKSMIITEYGADNDSRCHSFSAERFDYTVEYSVAYHKAYIKTILEKPFISGSNVWNLNDFASEDRVDAMPHINCKGLVTRDRTPKDSYWLYKAVLDREPFVKIAGHDWLIRGGDEGDVQPTEVYTNASSVELLLNGKSLGRKEARDGYAGFDICLKAGRNVLEAVAAKDGSTVRDLLEVDYRAVPADMSKFTDMSVSLGGTRFFEDRTGSLIWIPEKEYTPGRWGYLGGETGRYKTNRGSQPCSNQNILSTTEDPLYQMQRRGIESFKADVPDGKYYVYLYFCELSTSKEVRLAYNLGNDVLAQDVSDRVFDVAINGMTVLKDYDIRTEDGELHPVIKKFTVDVENGEGLTVGFTPVKGQPVLNAIRIYRCM